MVSLLFIRCQFASLIQPNVVAAVILHIPRWQESDQKQKHLYVGALLWGLNVLVIHIYSNKLKTEKKILFYISTCASSESHRAQVWLICYFTPDNYDKICAVKKNLEIKSGNLILDHCHHDILKCITVEKYMILSRISNNFHVE